MKTKSLGLGIILTLFFGPLGLFYASISGGLIMCLLPIILILLIVIGAVTTSLLLLYSTVILLKVFGISYWIICIIWAAAAVISHNNNVQNKERQDEILKIINENKYGNTSITTPTLDQQLSIPDNPSDTERPTYQDWKKDNPHKSINEYYSIYGATKSTMKSSNFIQPAIHQKSESSDVSLYILRIIAILLLLCVAYFFYKKNQGF